MFVTFGALQCTENVGSEDRPHMTSLIKQVRVISYEVIFLSIVENEIFRTLERVESNLPYCTTLVGPKKIRKD